MDIRTDVRNKKKRTTDMGAGSAAIAQQRAKGLLAGWYGEGSGETAGGKTPGKATVVARQTRNAAEQSSKVDAI